MKETQRKERLVIKHFFFSINELQTPLRFYLAIILKWRIISLYIYIYIYFMIFSIIFGYKDVCSSRTVNESVFANA